MVLSGDTLFVYADTPEDIFQKRPFACTLLTYFVYQARIASNQWANPNIS